MVGESICGYLHMVVWPGLPEDCIADISYIHASGNQWLMLNLPTSSNLDRLHRLAAV